MSARMGASRAFAKSRNQEMLKRRGSTPGKGVSTRSRNSNSDSKGNLVNVIETKLRYYTYTLNIEPLYIK